MFYAFLKINYLRLEIGPHDNDECSQFLAQYDVSFQEILKNA